jgi:MbtH protein
MENDYINPFDDERHQFFVLLNQKQQQSLWPEFAEIPSGWNKVFGPKKKQDCLNYIEEQAK